MYNLWEEQMAAKRGKGATGRKGAGPIPPGSTIMRRQADLASISQGLGGISSG